MNYVYFGTMAQLRRLRAIEVEMDCISPFQSKGYGEFFAVGKKKVEGENCLPLNTDEGVESLLKAMFIKQTKSGLQVKVQGNRIYTSAPGLLIGSRGSNIKEICRLVGRNLKVLPLDLGEEELLAMLDARFSQNNKMKVFKIAKSKNLHKVLEVLAEDPSTKIHAGDQYDHEAIEGKKIARELVRMGYKVADKYL